MKPTSEDDLDAELAELSGTRVAETAEQVQARVRALSTAIDHDANVDKGTVPGANPPPPIVVLDSIQHDVFGPGHLTVAIGDSTDGGIVELIIRSGGQHFTIANLTTHVATIKKVFHPVPLYAAPPAVTEYEYAIVRQLTACQPALAGLRNLIGDQALDIPLPQADAVMCFCTAYPRVWPKLVNAKIPVKFNSRTSDTRGGGLFDRNQIYLSKLFGTPAGAFVRLLVHEIGHALFEVTLLNFGKMPHDLATDKVADLARPVAQSVLRDLSANCQDIQRFWDGMSAQAKIFYQAWRTLRQGGGAHLLGLDLWEDPVGNRLAPSQRRPYQANDFGEFCAEVFMLYAMGDLQPYVLALLADGGIPQNVKIAWKNAWHVLELVASPILRS
jgi:hypothetical protein